VASQDKLRHVSPNDKTADKVRCHASEGWHPSLCEKEFHPQISQMINAYFPILFSLFHLL